jgi:hypothetical protein
LVPGFAGGGATGLLRGVAITVTVKAAEPSCRAACCVSALTLLRTLVAALLPRLGDPFVRAAAGWPEFWLEKPEDSADRSGFLLSFVVAPSSCFSAVASPPCFTRVGMPGTPPRLVMICDPARVAVCVLPPPVTVMLVPKTKSATVWLWLTERMVMPPRMPMLLDGVVMTMGCFLLILPPTRRKTPRLALMARSPVLVPGSKTKRSMVTRALGPTVSELPSRKTRCARSFAPVVTSSLACTSMPMRRIRSFSLGGLPSGSPSEPEVTPTRASESLGTMEMTAKPARSAPTSAR